MTDGPRQHWPQFPQHQRPRHPPRRHEMSSWSARVLDSRPSLLWVCSGPAAAAAAAALSSSSSFSCSPLALSLSPSLSHRSRFRPSLFLSALRFRLALSIPHTRPRTLISVVGCIGFGAPQGGIPVGDRFCSRFVRDSYKKPHCSESLSSSERSSRNEGRPRATRDQQA